MGQNISYIVSNSGTIMAVANGKSYNIPPDHSSYAGIKQAVIDDNADALERLANVVTALKKFVAGKVEVRDGQVFYQDHEIHNTVTSRILGLMQQGFPFEPAVKFLEKLMDNPSRRSVQELYTFLEHRALPITEDGDFLAYKRVREDWKDFHSGTFDNSVGKVLEMPRNAVDDDFRVDCSHGFHAGSIEYVSTFESGRSGHVVIVKINPKDVVSVPSDCNNQKLRTCRYEVVKVYEGDLTAPLYTNAGNEAPKQEFHGNGGYAAPKRELTADDQIEEEGKKAFANGKHESDNPYPVGTSEYYLWNDGWQEAEDEVPDDDEDDQDDDDDDDSDFDDDQDDDFDDEEDDDDGE